MLQISEKDITYAEQILFGKTGVFDKERINYIKENRTCDLQAVPGSGKTTVLLAKLLIIERHLPFVDGRAVLVISHTNAAMDEIKKEIGLYCPKLFSAPNFLGTIQSFIDRFLAIPYYINKYNKKPVRIDDGLYLEKSADYRNVFLKGFSTGESNKAKWYLSATNICGSYRFENRNEEIILTREYLGNKLQINKPKGRTKPENYKDWDEAEKKKVYDWLFKYKVYLLNLGYFCFDDSYFLAAEYLRKYPGITQILQQRFKHVYVDEMQDMDKNQHDLLENIFVDRDNSSTFYQRIGDKNQAIYTNEVNPDHNWTDRQLILKLNGSYRLSRRIAAIVQSLALHPTEVNGFGDIITGADIEIQPHMYVYTDSNKHLVIEKFATTLKQLQDCHKLPTNSRHPYKAICWNTKKEDGKIRICDFYPLFSKEVKKPKIILPVLESYLTLNNFQDNSFKQVRKNLLNCILRVLTLEHIYDESGRLYTKTSFLKFLQDKHANTFELLRTNLLIWCKDIFDKRNDSVLISLREFIITMLQDLNQSVQYSHDFLHKPLQKNGVSANEPVSGNINKVVHKGITIEVSTIHSSKGQTHTATLYLESFYEKNYGGGNYESERLAQQIKGTPLEPGSHKFVKQSIKMAYVGFSRPTHLLAFAVHKDRFNNKLSDIDTNIWKLIHL